MAMEIVSDVESPRFLTPTRKTFTEIARTPKPQPSSFTPIETDESELHMTPNVTRPQSRNSYSKTKLAQTTINTNIRYERPISQWNTQSVFDWNSTPKVDLNQSYASVTGKTKK